MSDAKQETKMQTRRLSISIYIFTKLSNSKDTETCKQKAVVNYSFSLCTCKLILKKTFVRIQSITNKNSYSLYWYKSPTPVVIMLIINNDYKNNDNMNNDDTNHWLIDR